MVKTSNLFNKTLVVGVIVLFLGVGIQQAIATVQQEEEIDIVQELPDISFFYEILGGNCLTGWDISISVIATDGTYGMDRLVIYFNDVLKEIVYGPVCVFVWEFHYPPKPDIILKAVAYDLAGNSAMKSFNLNKLDLNRHSRNNFSNTYLQNVFSKWLIDRFLLLEVFLRIINLLR